MSSPCGCVHHHEPETPPKSSAWTKVLWVLLVLAVLYLIYKFFLAPSLRPAEKPRASDPWGMPARAAETATTAAAEAPAEAAETAKPKKSRPTAVTSRVPNVDTDGRLLSSADDRPGSKLGMQQFEFADGILNSLERKDGDKPVAGDDEMDRYYKKWTKKLPRPSDRVQAREDMHDDMWEGAADSMVRAPRITSVTGDRSTEVEVGPPPTDMWMNMPVARQR